MCVMWECWSQSIPTQVVLYALFFKNVTGWAILHTIFAFFKHLLQKILYVFQRNAERNQNTLTHDTFSLPTCHSTLITNEGVVFIGKGVNRWRKGSCVNGSLLSINYTKFLHSVENTESCNFFQFCVCVLGPFRNIVWPWIKDFIGHN